MDWAFSGRHVKPDNVQSVHLTFLCLALCNDGCMKYPGSANPGAAEMRHSADLSYVFCNANKDAGVLTSRPFSQAEQKLSAQMIDYWTQFAKTGNPNRKGLPVWPIYQSARSVGLSFSDGGARPQPLSQPYCRPLIRQWRENAAGGSETKLAG